GKTEILRACHIALLNPMGRTESFPASPLECMACGVPVVSSSDYGMSDTMRFFPELSIKSPKEILDKIQTLVQDPMLYELVQIRSLAVAKWYAGQAPEILFRWNALLRTVTKHTVKHLPLAPTTTFYGSKIQLVMRTLYCWFFLLKTYPLRCT